MPLRPPPGGISGPPGGKAPLPAEVIIAVCAGIAALATIVAVLMCKG